MKTFITSLAFIGLAAPAMAGPYANVEANSGFTGSDYSGTSTDFHVGYEANIRYFFYGSFSINALYRNGFPNCILSNWCLFK